MGYLRKSGVLFLVLISLQGFSQNPAVDSLKLLLKNTQTDSSRVKLCNELFLNFEFADTVQAAEYLAKALQIAKKAKYDAGLITTYINYGYFYEDKGDYPGAIRYYEKGLRIAETEKSRKEIAACYKNIGNASMLQGYYSQAIDNYQQAMHIAEEMNDKNLLSKCLTNIGSIHLYQANYDKAADYYKRSIKIAEELGDIKRKADCLNNLGLVYTNQGKFDDAISNCKKSLEVCEKLGDWKGMANALHNLGLAYASKEDDQQTYDNYQNALKIYEEIGDKKGMALCLNSIGKLYYRQSKYNEALTCSRRSLEMANDIGSPDDQKNAFGNLSDNYYKLGMYKQAYDYIAKYFQMTDSLKNLKMIKEITQREMIYDFDKRQKEIQFEIQKKEIAQKEEMKSQKNLRNFFLGAFALTLILLFFIYSNFRAKKRANVLLEKQKAEIEEKNREITSSIRYAKRIQEASLPAEKVFRQHLPDSFILYKPKDIVSGDFYWVERKGDKILFAVADCTGHGVPGAFISIIGYNGLNKAVHEYGLTSPAEILNKLNAIVNDSLQQTFEESSVRDGMDISLCCYDSITGILEFSGANNPVYVHHNGELIRYRADRQPIGHFIDFNPKPFTNHTIRIANGDTLYLFSDGYRDQFGGPRGKKLKTENFQHYLVSVAELISEQQKEILEKNFVEWCGNHPQLDDVCVIGVRF